MIITGSGTFELSANGQTYFANVVSNWRFDVRSSPLAAEDTLRHGVFVWTGRSLEPEFHLEGETNIPEDNWKGIFEELLNFMRETGTI